MNCIVTAGPTYEPLDNVRRLTNFSTGRLGTELANFLVNAGHQVILLRGEQATYQNDSQAQSKEVFTTTADLLERLRTLSNGKVDAVFHAAAVSDYAFGAVKLRTPSGEMKEIRSGKIATRDGVLVAELVPTPKIILQLRGWYPAAKLVGWKFEVEGDRDGVIALAERQMTECHTDACVANGKAYGSGFGLVTSTGQCEHLKSGEALFAALEKFISG